MTAYASTLWARYSSAVNHRTVFYQLNTWPLFLMDKTKIKTWQAFIRIIKIENSTHEKCKSAQDIKLYYSTLKCNDL